MELQPIEKGATGWKKRRLEIAILATVRKATTPQSGWDVFQKLRRKAEYVIPNGDELAVMMADMHSRGYLSRVGEDNDCGYTYSA